MERELLREKHVVRYTAADDFGLPTTAFLICRFWLVDAWWSLDRREEARELLVGALAYRNRYGLLSEDIDPGNGTLWGNFPQTYSMAGLILAAMRLSRSWEDRSADRSVEPRGRPKPRWRQPGRRAGRCRALAPQAA
jgi:GH15 family glucan-1,4-alpha-glucosidase